MSTSVPRPLRVLHVAAEIFPWVKTGGLADVTGALPAALVRAGVDVRLMLPGLPPIVDALVGSRVVCELGPLFGAGRVQLRLGELPGSVAPAYVVDAPYRYRRAGGPYQDEAGTAWPDNLERFAMLGWMAAHLASGELDEGWTPDILHAHDWHAGLACAYAKTHPGTAARTVFTIHNLAYQGLFPAGDFEGLDLPRTAMMPAGVEFHGHLSFMKGGLSYADRITTVSPTYAREIATPEFGVGLEGVIRARQADVSGILNGVDPAVWSPETDRELAARYRANRLGGKAKCKEALQRELGLASDASRPLLAVVSRLTEQKGLDIVLAALPMLLELGVQIAVVGKGDAPLEAAFRQAGEAHPDRVAVRLVYDEALAHRIMGGADAIVVPSRFEPCGLTQLYGLRYGTLPLVRRVGGLVDTVVDADAAALESGRATGFAFDRAEPGALVAAAGRLVELFRQPSAWQRVMRRAMAQDFSWDHAAHDYAALYRALSAAPRGR